MHTKSIYHGLSKLKRYFSMISRLNQQLTSRWRTMIALSFLTLACGIVSSITGTLFEYTALKAISVVFAFISGLIPFCTQILNRPGPLIPVSDNRQQTCTCRLCHDVAHVYPEQTIASFANRMPGGYTRIYPPVPRVSDTLSDPSQLASASGLAPQITSSSNGSTNVLRHRNRFAYNRDEQHGYFDDENIYSDDGYEVKDTSSDDDYQDENIYSDDGHEDHQPYEEVRGENQFDEDQSSDDDQSSGSDRSSDDMIQQGEEEAKEDQQVGEFHPNTFHGDRRLGDEGNEDENSEDTTSREGSNEDTDESDEEEETYDEEPPDDESLDEESDEEEMSDEDEDY